MTSRGLAALSRRGFLALASGACFAADTGGKGRIFPSFLQRFPDPATEFPILRLTDPDHTSFLPPSYARSVARRGNFLAYASDMTGKFQAFRLDLRTGQSRQLTASEDFHPRNFTLFGDDRYLAYCDGPRLIAANLAALRTREIYRMPGDSEPGFGLAVAEDAQFAALIEKRGSAHCLRLVHLADGSAAKLAEADEELRDPVPRPHRAAVLYRRAGSVWLANYDARQNYRLRLAGGAIGPATWSADGRTVLYLNYPADPRRLHAIREFTPDTNEDRLVAETSQFVAFSANADGSVFVGASGSKASPYVLLLVRAVRRELTLAEHRASDPAMVSPVFSANSQHIYFVTDRGGKPAIYTMSVAKFVEETASAN
jgi:oligogalacturonide lyase